MLSSVKERRSFDTSPWEKWNRLVHGLRTCMLLRFKMHAKYWGVRKMLETWWLRGRVNFLSTCSHKRSLKRSLRQFWRSHNWRSWEETKWRDSLMQILPLGGILIQVGRGIICSHTSRCEVGWCEVIVPRRLKLGRVHWEVLSHVLCLATGAQIT